MTLSAFFRAVADAAFIGAAGIALGWAANALSPAGIVLGRNYFPGAAEELAADSGSPRSVEQRLEAKGLQASSHDQVLAWFNDPRRELGLIVFVDARNSRQFQESHIPGALPFDPYRMERHIDSTLPACQIAEVVVVYCSGGDCEDSESAALALLQNGVAPEQVFIYPGGMHEWQSAGLPVEPAGSQPRLPSPPDA